MVKKIRLSLAVEKDVSDQLRLQAKKENRSLSNYVEIILKEFLKNKEGD